MAPELKLSAARLKDWVITRALPLWAKRAQREDGSWVEHLTLDGAPDKEAERRWRVLARQVYVYAEASRLGWYDGEAIARSTFEQLVETGYVQRVTSDGLVTERRRDLYDHAFYLLASASLFRATGEAQYLRAAKDILDDLDEDFAHPKGGWRETPRGAQPRRQNPHMHILEASLYLYAGTGKAAHRAYADKVFKLFQANFFDADHVTIREYFTNDWQVLSDESGDTAEPGHAMEWVWLLQQYQKATGRDTQKYADQLYAQTQKWRGPILPDETDVFGTIRRDTTRLWVMTETIKAHLAQTERGIVGPARMASAIIDGMFGTVLKADGTWHDKIDANGKAIATTIPVSTFYHIMSLAAEAERVANLPSY